MGTKNKILILSIGFLLFLSSASSASALELLYPPVIGAETPQDFSQKIADCRTICENEGPTSLSCLTCERDGYHSGGAFPLYLKYIYYLLIHACGLACFYAFVSGGLYFLLAGDSPLKAKEGLNRLNLGVLGTAIILASVLILNILNPVLLLFKMARIEPPEAIVLDIPEVIEEFPAYVEIPIGGLIEALQQRSFTVDKVSAAVATTSKTIASAAACLERLTMECQCDREEANVDTCCGDWEGEGEDPGSQTCVEEEVAEGESCPRGGCRPYSDPCNVEIATDLCSDLGQTVDSNLRAAIQSKILYLASLTTQIGIQREGLMIVEDNLGTAIRQLRVAEGMMRSSISPAISFETFAGLNDKEIIRIFPRVVLIGGTTGGSGDQFEYAQPGPECQGHSPQEDMPRCILCLSDAGDELVCFGNNYRCCETNGYISAMCSGNDNCTNPPRHTDQESCDLITFAGCQSPRNCSDGWKSGEDMINGVGGNSFMYNGISYEIPAGGTYFVGSTVMMGCAAYR